MICPYATTDKTCSHTHTHTAKQKVDVHTCSIPTELGWLFVSAATPLLSDFTGTLMLRITAEKKAVTTSATDQTSLQMVSKPV